MKIILVSDQLDEVGWEMLRAAPDVQTLGPFATRAEVIAALPTAHALIIRSTTQVDSELLQHAPNLRVIARAGSRLDNVDLEQATRLGILVCNAPEPLVNAVAEYTIALLFQLARPMLRGHQQLRQGTWNRHELLGFELAGKTLGIVGFGRIGQEVARKALALGMTVLAYDPIADIAFTRHPGVQVVTWHELLAQSDIITLHASYNPQTHHLLNAESLARCREGVYIVNTEHPNLIDELALLDSLAPWRVSGAALDTVQQEPPPPDHPLLNHPRVIVLPHLNQNTREAQQETSRQVVESVLAALREEDYIRAVNLPFSPEVPYRQYRAFLQLAERLGRVQGQLARVRRIHTVEVELQGEGLQQALRPLAVAMLKGMLKPYQGRDVNYVNAPIVAHEQGIQIRQSRGLPQVDYPNLLSCRVCWEGGSEVLSGMLFGGSEPRLVQYGDYRVDAKLDGWLLFLENADVPGVIGKVGTLLWQHNVNIAEWRYGRAAGKENAISFINLDAPCPPEALQEIKKMTEIARARAIVV